MLPYSVELDRQRENTAFKFIKNSQNRNAVNSIKVIIFEGEVISYRVSSSWNNKSKFKIKSIKIRNSKESIGVVGI